MKTIKALWRRAGCVGGDCDALYPADGGMIAIPYAAIHRSHLVEE